MYVYILLILLIYVSYASLCTYVFYRKTSRLVECLNVYFFHNSKYIGIPFKIPRFKKQYQEIKKNGLYYKKIHRKDYKFEKRMLNQERIISYFYSIDYSNPILSKM